MNNKALLVMSGYNIRAVIAFLRVCEKNNIQYYIIASGDNDPIFNTEYSKKIVKIRRDKDINNIFNLALEIRKEKKLETIYFIPTTEYLNRYLLENRNKFEDNNIKIPLTQKELYNNISDKYEFRKMCMQNNLLVTQKYYNIETAKFPCVLKPLSYNDYKGKPILLNNKDDYKEEYDKKFFVEEYVPGDSYYLLYYFKKDGTYLKFSQHSLKL